MAEIDSNYRYLTYEEMGKEVAEKALDEILISGKSLREWVQAIVSEDCISRRAALDAMYALCDTGETLRENPWRDNPHIDAIIDAIENLPTVIPQESKEP